MTFSDWLTTVNELAGYQVRTERARNAYNFGATPQQFVNAITPQYRPRTFLPNPEGVE